MHERAPTHLVNPSISVLADPRLIAGVVDALALDAPCLAYTEWADLVSLASTQSCRSCLTRQCWQCWQCWQSWQSLQNWQCLQNWQQRKRTTLVEEPGPDRVCYSSGLNRSGPPGAYGWSIHTPSTDRPTGKSSSQVINTSAAPSTAHAR